MVNSLDELKDFLDLMMKLVEDARDKGWPEQTNTDIICTKIWKEFTPHAIRTLTMAGMLEHIAWVLDPPTSEDDDDDE